MESVMTTAPRSFRRSVERKANRTPPVEFTLETLDEDMETVVRSDTFHASMPTDETMFLIAALAGADDADGAAEAAAVMDLFKGSLPEDEFRTLRSRLKDPEDDVSIEMLQDVLMWLMEQWTAFPTVPSSDSSPSPASTGTTSTGRVRGKGSTHSNSPSIAS